MVPLKGDIISGFTASFDGGRIRSVPDTKYLGLHLSEGFDFLGRAMKLLESSSDVFSRLKSVRKSKWGVSSAISLIIYKAFYITRILYGAMIWYPSATSADTRKKMESAQRRVLHGVTGAYNTVSTTALQVLVGTPPIHLHIESMIRVYNGMAKSDSEAILIEQWQTLWDSSIKGRWTHEFFPDISVRIQTPIPFDHYTAQIVTGHGDFNGKLHYFNLADTPQCSCGHIDESAEHISRACPKYDDLRSRLQDSLRRSGVEWPCELTAFTTSRSSWTTLGKFAREALIRKETILLEERIRLREEDEQNIHHIQ